MLYILNIIRKAITRENIEAKGVRIRIEIRS